MTIRNVYGTAASHFWKQSSIFYNNYLLVKTDKTDKTDYLFIFIVVYLLDKTDWIKNTFLETLWKNFEFRFKLLYIEMSSFEIRMATKTLFPSKQTQLFYCYCVNVYNTENIEDLIFVCLFRTEIFILFQIWFKMTRLPYNLLYSITSSALEKWFCNLQW